MDKQEPVAWMYEWTGPDPKDVTQFRKERPTWPLREGWTETPLYTRANRPADDGLVDDEGWATSIAQHLCAPADRSAAIRLIADALVRFQAATTLRAQSDAEVEREAVCKWLRGLGYQAIMPGAYYADAIERGEHRKDGV